MRDTLILTPEGEIDHARTQTFDAALPPRGSPISSEELMGKLNARTSDTNLEGEEILVNRNSTNNSEMQTVIALLKRLLTRMGEDGDLISTTATDARDDGRSFEEILKFYRRRQPNEARRILEDAELNNRPMRRARVQDAAEDFEDMARNAGRKMRDGR